MIFETTLEEREEYKDPRYKIQDPRKGEHADK